MVSIVCILKTCATLYLGKLVPCFISVIAPVVCGLDKGHVTYHITLKLQRPESLYRDTYDCIYIQNLQWNANFMMSA